VPVPSASHPVAKVKEEEADTSAPLDETNHCICRGKGKEGRMIGCDNAACPFQWLHLSCLALDNAPTGRWFCVGSLCLCRFS
jgi:hypothetical protein